MAMSDRGFASMAPEKRAAICSLGGKAAHAAKTAHEWTPKTARIAGRKSGLARRARRALALKELRG